ncbi:hypothetical protein AVEN_166675-1 [Araneus ventricosus]|uniref:Uncharacterized protein n=1 Tax=Araneus ventricosus TaxID=182803 RepID=A0A4Y2HGF9_ARAVE|nr:hypothetical protein AVEN_166675-1 [Araneus ventricosus]
MELKKEKQLKTFQKLSRGIPLLQPRTASKRLDSKNSAIKSEKKKPSFLKKAKDKAPAPNKLIFAPTLNENFPEIFINAEVFLARDNMNSVAVALEIV